VNFICPSCGKTNAVPDVWAGNCFVCRKCETQVTAPDMENARAHSWLASPGWRAVAVVEALAVAGIFVLAVLLLTTRPPADLPFVAGSDDREPQLARPGGSLAIDVGTGVTAAGGCHHILRQDVRLTLDDDREYLLDVHAGPKPWPPALVGATTAPEAAPLTPRLTVDLPNGEDLAGHSGTIHLRLHIEYPVQREPGAPVELARHAPTQELPITIATPQQALALASARRVRHVSSVGVIVCAVVATGVALAALALAEKRITVICPECGRATEATYYHERGDLHVTKCPHKRG
jgi:hypothetical protein